MAMMESFSSSHSGRVPMTLGEEEEEKEEEEEEEEWSRVFVRFRRRRALR